MASSLIIEPRQIWIQASTAGYRFWTVTEVLGDQVTLVWPARAGDPCQEVKFVQASTLRQSSDWRLWSALATKADHNKALAFLRRQ